jgi:sialate O-acetylesterase
MTRFRSTRTVPNCGIAVANDIGEANDIHPKNKLDVGKRLALLALQQTYGQAIDPSCSPLYKDHSIAGNQVTVRFDHLGEGLKSRDGAALQRFELLATIASGIGLTPRSRRVVTA